LKIIMLKFGDSCISMVIREIHNHGILILFYIEGVKNKIQTPVRHFAKLTMKIIINGACENKLIMPDRMCNILKIRV